MWHTAAKIALTVVLIVAASEIAKRSTFWGAVLAALPLVSLLAIVWLYVETGNKESVAILSGSIFWLVLPSLPAFLFLPFLLRSGWAFWPSLGAAATVTVLLYFGLVRALQYFDIRL